MTAEVKIHNVETLDNWGYKPVETKETGIKTTYVGTKTFRDTQTGELIELEYIEKKVSHSLKKGWRRVYLENFMELLAGLYSAGRKIDVIEFILNNLDSENKLCYTQEQVAKKSKVSKQIVVDTYKYLVKHDFMKKQGSVYVVNPKFVCAIGSDKKNRMIGVRYSYDDEEQPTLFDKDSNFRY